LNKLFVKVNSILKAFLIFWIFVILFGISSFFNNKKKDMWICEKGKWIKQGNPIYPKPIITCGDTETFPKNKEDCMKTGGIWKKQGPEPFETCNRKAVDRGNLCRDNGECEGWCQVELSKEELRKGMSNKANIDKKYGQCSVWIVELGCFGIMEKGETKVICID